VQLFRSKHIFIALSIVSFAFAYLLQAKVNSPDCNEIAANFQDKLQEKEAALEHLLDEIYEVEEAISFDIVLDKKEWLQRVQDLEGFSVLVFERDSLVLWSDNNIPLPKSYKASQERSGLKQFQNGWYDVRIKSKGERSIVGYILIKREYPFENRFLSNQFQQDFDVPPGVILSEFARENSALVASRDGAKFGYLSFVENGSTAPPFLSFTWFLTLILFSIGILAAVIYLEYIVSVLGDHFGAAMVSAVFVISVIALRALMIWNKFPDLLYKLPIFSPSFYGTSSIFPSLGDFFLNGLVASWLAYYIYDRSTSTEEPQSPTLGWEYVKIASVLLIAIPLFILIEGLVLNSSISFNINNFSELNYMSIIGILSLGLFLFFFYFLAEAALKQLSTLSIKTIAIVALSAFLTFALACFLLQYSDPALILWPPTFVAIILFKNYRELHLPDDADSKSSRLYPTIALIVIASLFISHSTTHSYAVKELEQRKALALKLAVENDPVAEYMYAELERSLQEDTAINVEAFQFASNNESLFEHINDKHLRGFWEKYDVQMTVCQTEDSLFIQEQDRTVSCLSFFKGLVKTQGNSTMAKNFFHLDNNNGRVSYLGILEYEEMSIFMEFDSKIIPDELGFPELLLDLEVSQHLRDALKFYSYAKFKDGKISSQSGEFRFGGKLPEQEYEDEYAIIDAEDYNHLFYKVDASTTIILSRKLDQPLDPIFRFSYFFAMFCLMALLFAGIRVPLTVNAMRLSFRKRIELSMILVLLISLIPIAVGTKYYIERQYRTRNDQNIREKIQSVLIEVEHKLADEEKLTGELQEYVAYLLQKFSYVFFTDINLYDLNGSLIASSRPKMFKEGLIGDRMNTAAYTALAVHVKPEFLHEEEIGELSFLSAYALFRNKDQEVLAYINLPYFAKQDDVKKEVSTFFVALFNIYVVLILIAVVIALIISNRITQPLRLIQEKLSKVSLGSANEPIDWKGQDEIGRLVDQYNRMLGELETSAALLAKSERESAWREMAKQVAHEIKNPLTPMKLSVQHLQRAYKDKNVDWEKKLNQFTQSLIQQIDALTNIANEFSNFAKMPKTKNAVIELSDIIQNAIDLFQEASQVEISFVNGAAEEAPLLVLADKEQLNQVLNNLIKNAIQAIPEPEEGRIDIRIFKQEHMYVVEVKDNGSGINPEEFDKIFAPNFTTKTGGMGLGLALVKNMIESVAGNVWFESKKNEGSSFFFSIPIHHI